LSTVDLHQLQETASARIAALTQDEAALACAGPRRIFLNAELLQPGEAELVARCLGDVVKGAGAATSRQKAREEDVTW
jgi:hypothetical protein